MVRIAIMIDHLAVGLNGTQMARFSYQRRRGVFGSPANSSALSYAGPLARLCAFWGSVWIGISDAGPEDCFLSNDGEGFVEWQDSSSKGACRRPAFLP
jgi:hypothetical protein